MAVINDIANTFNAPNYTGVLYQLTPSDAPFLSAIGGLSGGGESTEHTQFEWQTFDLRDAGQNVALEGADAPAASNRKRSNVSNVVQIHQEVVGVSYTKLAATQQKAGVNNAERNPVSSELDWQVAQRLKEIKRDAEYSFIRGVYNKPADNTTARKTRGILEAIVTNVTVGADADDTATGLQPSVLTEADVLDTMQAAWENGGLQESETATLMANADLKRALTSIFITDKGYDEESRNVGGVNLQTIETDFGRVNIMLNRYMPADSIAIVSMEQCRPRFLLVPDKGFLFAEPLAKNGAQDRVQIYGEMGLEYGNERSHAKLTNFKRA